MPGVSEVCVCVPRGGVSACPSMMGARVVWSVAYNPVPLKNLTDSPCVYPVSDDLPRPALFWEVPPSVLVPGILPDCSAISNSEHAHVCITGTLNSFRAPIE